MSHAFRQEQLSLSLTCVLGDFTLIGLSMNKNAESGFPMYMKRFWHPPKEEIIGCINILVINLGMNMNAAKMQTSDQSGQTDSLPYQYSCYTGSQDNFTLISTHIQAVLLPTVYPLGTSQ